MAKWFRSWLPPYGESLEGREPAQYELRAYEGANGGDNREHINYALPGMEYVGGVESKEVENGLDKRGAPSSIRRLAKEQAALHQSLPPNYLFSADVNSASMPDDLTQLTILLAGPDNTPYSQGLWRLHFRMPEDYPASPPKASFKTRIWHPNVEESTGAICVDTLKRDWQPSLTLKDVLIPNPDSALNSAAGSLLQDDYEAFARQARLMTSIHARIPVSMSEAAKEAKSRGDSLDLKSKSDLSNQTSNVSRSLNKSFSQTSNKTFHRQIGAECQAPVSEQLVCKDENAAMLHLGHSQSQPSSDNLVSKPKTNLGKRPLENIINPTDGDGGDKDVNTFTSENGSLGFCKLDESEMSGEPLKKSPKYLDQRGGSSSQALQSTGTERSIKPHPPHATQANGDGKENFPGTGKECILSTTLVNSKSVIPRKTPSANITRGRAPRIGIRRL
ncbi:MAG: hypothetical protein Q9227_002800 [Pyrenula ochraceoflavens]